MNGVLSVCAAVFGAAVGSFLNVLIHRLPSGQSIISPPSHCPACHHRIRFYDNIPLVSYLILRGRCRDCGNTISPRYPLVELLTAAMSVVLFLRFGIDVRYLFSFIFTASLIVVTFIDLDHQIIPDVITLPGIPVFFLAAVGVMGVPVIESLLGIVLGGGSLYLIAVVYELLTKREGMGGGDIKLLAMLGAFLGWKSLFYILFVSSFLGALVGVALMFLEKKDMKYAVPFGPFLSIAAVSYLFFGQTVMNFFFPPL